ncbi:MAG: ROK family protein [Christensenellaceae bacterium]
MQILPLPQLALKGIFPNGAAFTALNVLSGEGTLDGEKFTAGNSFFIPCGETIYAERQRENYSYKRKRREQGMNYYAGIDLGGTFIKCGLVDETGNIICKDKIPTGKERPYREIAADMAKLVFALADRAQIGSRRKGGGDRAPGSIDSKRRDRLQQQYLLEKRSLCRR